MQWLADVIRRHGLDAARGFTLDTATLANTDAARIALMAGSADVVVSDWIFAATQRARGTALAFAPLSGATGAIMVPAASPARGIADLRGLRLGVAGGPLDRSWIIVQAAARAGSGLDLASAAQVAYGAAPLLAAKLQQGELDAALVFWTYAARLEVAGFRQLASVADCARTLGLPGDPGLIGFAFREDWARAQPAAINGLLAATAEAERILAHSDEEWRRIRPLMNAPDDALFGRLRTRFLDGLAHPDPAAQQKIAAEGLDIILRTAGDRATGGLTRVPDGLFWPTAGGGSE